MRLIDLFVNRNKIYAWLKGKGKNKFVAMEFSFNVYVLAKAELLLYVKDCLYEKGISSKIVIKKTLNGRRRVLEVKLDIKTRYLIGQIIRWCGYSCEIFNSDVPLPELFMFENDLFPTAKVKIKEGKISTKEDPFEAYNIPKLKKCYLKLETSVPLRRSTLGRIKKLQYNNLIFENLPEEVILRKFVKYFLEEDPDIIITEDGEVELPFLLERIRKYNSQFSFSRFGYDKLQTRGQSYFTYGRTIYKHNAVKLKGRLHFRHKGTLYGSWTINYPFELARICSVTLQGANARSIGYCCSNRQLYIAHKHGFLIPRNSGCVERWKSGLELFNADRGSLILEPVIGYHDNCAEIDFISLFPSIMVNENISTETLYCKCCNHNKVPGLNMNTCTKERGIMADVLAPIIKQRQYYKRQGLREREQALKGLLVTSFGYMGFRKSKFARIEAHQAIQAYAREILLKTIKIAEDAGFEVLHGVVDSLWVKKKGITKESVMQLIKTIKEELGYEAKLEGVYKWIMFWPSVNHKDVPVPTRYYGVFENGELKCRGIDIRKHDTPEILKKLQLRIVNELSKSKDKDEFEINVLKSNSFVKDVIQRISSGNVVEDDLIITRGLTKIEYKSQSPQAVVMKKLKSAGFNPKPGDYARYIITNKASEIPGNRYKLKGQANFSYDKLEYAILARKLYKNMFVPSKAQLTIYEAIRKSKQAIEVMS